jgi:lipid A 3-O-deacylase
MGQPPQHRLARPLTCGVLWATLCGLSVPTIAQQAQARPLIDEVRFGVLAHDVPGLWSGWTIENRKPDLNGEIILSPSLAFAGGKIRPALGGTWHTGGGTSKAYVDARWEYQTALGVFFGLGLGVAVHNGYRDTISSDHKALGSRVLFHIPIEVGYRFDNGQTLSVYFEHMSNGYTQRANEGLDSLGIRYGFRF